MMILGILFLGYYLVICRYLRRWDSPFPRLWALLGLLCISWTLLRERIPEPVREGITVLTGAVLVLFFLVECAILSGMREREPEETCRWIIVLGARVDGVRLTDALRQRLDRALICLKASPGTKVIVSGGQGPGELATEAAVMAAYLEDHGIKRERIWEEDASTTTRENLVYSGRIVQREEKASSWEEAPGKVPVGIVTNSFHLFRALFTARQVGYRKAAGLAAPTTWLMLPNYMTREFFGVLKMLCQGRKKPD